MTTDTYETPPSFLAIQDRIGATLDRIPLPNVARHRLAIVGPVLAAEDANLRLQLRAIEGMNGGHMPRLSTVTAATKKLTIPVGGQKLTITYKPAIVTPRMLEQILAMSDDASLVPVLGTLSDLLDGWDLVDDDDQPIPTTREALTGVPFTLLLSIMNAIGADLATSAAPSNGAR